MSKKLKNSSIIAIVIVVALSIAFGVLLVVFLNQNEENQQIYIEEKIRILDDDILIGEFTFIQLSEICAPVEFNAVYKPNGQLPIERTYSGIFMKDLLLGLGIDLTDKSAVYFTASDGMQKVYSIEDIMDEGNVYLANKVNGELFNKGIESVDYPQESGGPYVVIKAKDAVSQNRVKLLVEINIK